MSESTILFRRIAVSSKVVTDAQVEECLERLESTGTKLELGEALAFLGYITKEQQEFLKIVSSGRGNRISSEEPEPGISFMAKLVVERGMATPEQVVECLRIRSERSVGGKEESLGAVMLERRYLTQARLAELDEEKEELEMVCMSCGRKYFIPRYRAVNAQCPDCREDLAAVESKGPKEIRPKNSPVGKEIGGCRIGELIGRGAMGAVYQARHVGLNREVAVKLLSMKRADPDRIRRLLFEARAIAKVEHPNIVHVYDVGYQNDFFFVVMQLLRGETLSRRLQETSTLIRDAAVGIIRDVALGLKAAHAAGIIHRDVKPDNIIITDDGRARVTDFGLAQDVKDADELEGLIVGTPYYMSPEQWLGEKADERSDIYALGIIYYQMLVGRRPFETRDFNEMMQRHLKSVPKAPHLVDPEIPEEISAIVRKMVAKVATSRYQNTGELLADLDRQARGEIPEAMEQYGPKVRCKFCETVNPAKEEKCSVCREPLHGAAGNLLFLPRQDEISCPKCGGIVRKGSRACDNCGVGFCSTCRQRLPEVGEFCKLCVEHQPAPKRLFTKLTRRRRRRR